MLKLSYRANVILGDEIVKRYVLITFSVLICVNLLAWSSLNTLKGMDEKKAVIATATRVNASTNIPSDSKWTNKTYVSIGDSISWQDKQSYPASKTIAMGYQSLLNESIGFKRVINYSIVGASMAESSKYPNKDSIMARFVNKDYSAIDVVTVLAGTNDFRLNVPIGAIGEKDEKGFDVTTFYGSYRKLLDYILEQNNSIKIYLLAPLQRDNDGYDIYKINPAGYKLIDYVDATIKIGKLYKLPVLDLYSKSGIDIFNLKQYTRDGLHPNAEGYELISRSIYDFLEKN